MPTQTVAFQAWSTNASTASTSKTLPIPSTWAAGQLAVVHYAGAIAPDATPTGWTLRASQTGTAGFYSGIYTKRLVSGDIGSTLTFAVATAGKCSITGIALDTNQGQVVVLGAAPFLESTLSSTHALTPIVTGGPGSVLTFLALKDSATGISATITAPTGFGSQAGLASGGSNQISSFGAYNTGGDVAASSTYGTGKSWSVADGAATPAPVTSINAMTWQLYVAAVNRPIADVTVAAGATFVGGTTITGVTSDDDPATYETYSGTSVTNTVRIDVSTVVPSAVFLDLETDVAATSTSIQAFLDLGSTQLVNLGTVTTLIPTAAAGGTTLYFSTSGLTGTQVTNILADAAATTPVGLRLRWVSSVS